MKRFIFVTLAILLIIGFILSGCSNSSSLPSATTFPATSAPTSSASATSVPQTTSVPSATQAGVQPITLSFAHHETTESSLRNNGFVPWMENVEKATHGRVKIVEYPAETLLKQADEWQGVINDVADISWCGSMATPGVFPLADIITLPYLPILSGEQGSAVLWQLYEKFPEIQNEYRDVHILTMHIAGPYNLDVKKRQVKTLEDLKGLRIRTIPGPPTDSAKLMGVTPIMIPISGIYDALQKGVLDGTGSSPNAIMEMRLYELAPYYTDVSLYAGNSWIAMNLEKWNSLPKDIQQEITSVSGLDAAKLLGKAFHDDAAASLEDTVKKSGDPWIEYTLPPQELARWESIGGKPVWDTYIKQLEAKGLPAQKVLDEALQLLQNNN